MSFALTRLERIYAAVETTFGTAVTVTGSNACRFVKNTIDNDVAEIKRPDKTGNRTEAPASAGRKKGTWSTEMSLAPNGAAGVVPDFDPWMQATFGQAAVIVASTSATYSLSDSIKSFSLYDYRQPSTIDQRVSIGSTVTNATFQIGQDGAATITFEGENVWGLQSNQFSVADPTQKGGLSSFAVEPASPVTNGGIIAGFTGIATLNGTAIATLINGKVSIGTGNDIVRDTFNTYYGSATEGDMRRVTTSFSIYEDDSASYAGLVAASQSKAGIAIIYQIGTVAGSICTITLSGVQLGTHKKEEARRFKSNFPDSPVRGTGNKDEITIAFT